MTYDSEEQKELAKSIEVKTKATFEFMKNPENIRHIEDYMDKVNPMLQALNDKAHAGEQLTEEELLFLAENKKFLKEMEQSLADMQQLINNKLLVQSDSFFHHVSKLAREGNEEAKKAYEQLLPLYKKSKGLDSNEPVDNN